MSKTRSNASSHVANTEKQTKTQGHRPSVFIVYFPCLVEFYLRRGPFIFVAISRRVNQLLNHVLDCHGDL